MAAAKRSVKAGRARSPANSNERWAPVAALLLGVLGTVAIQKVVTLTIASAWPAGEVMTAIAEDQNEGFSDSRPARR